MKTVPSMLPGTTITGSGINAWCGVGTISCVSVLAYDDAASMYPSLHWHEHPLSALMNLIRGRYSLSHPVMRRKR